jgi:hypothetical protein
MQSSDGAKRNNQRRRRRGKQPDCKRKACAGINSNANQIDHNSLIQSEASIVGAPPDREIDRSG